MVPHLLLADDSLFFCRAMLGYLTYLKYIFDSYTIASRQCFNYDKSFLLSSPKVKPGVHWAIIQVFGFLWY